MGELKIGQQVGTWKSAMGDATITVKKEIGTYETYDEALTAAHGKQSVLTLEKGQIHVYEVDDGAYLDDLNLGEHVKPTNGGQIGKATIVDFVGDDGYQLNAGQKKLPPTGPDNGKVVYFFRHYSTSTMDKAMNHVTDSERAWYEEIADLRKKGYTVVMDPHATVNDMQKAFYDPKAAGVIYSGHGNDKGVVVDDGQGGWTIFTSNHLEKNKVSTNMKLVVFQSCDTGKGADNWADVTHGAKIAGWKKKVPNGETNASNDPVWTALKVAAVTKSPVAAAAAYYLIPNKLDKLIDENL